MPKKNIKAGIHLDLLKPQSNPEKILVRLLKWLLSSGRYIFIIVEAVVLIAFITRFKLDADLASKKEAIEQQIPYIESLKPFEILIRQTQLKLTTIHSIQSDSVDFSQILKKIADQTPAGVKINTLNLEKTVGKVGIQISAESQNNNDLVTFTNGLKQEGSFSDVTITGISFEKGSINFSLSAQANSSFLKEKTL